MTIFIQIAAYREAELLPTIWDCLAMARYPDDLRFGICWQKEEGDDSLAAFSGDKRFRIDPVPWQQSRGLCWARARIQGLYQGEDYTLQLDAHHRFAPHWDETLLRFTELTGSRKPILTSYAGMYDPATDLKLNDDPYKMVADRFTESGTILFRPHSIEGWQDLRRPIPARFVSGHFFFTIGAHCQEYRYDPNLYFAGDEISLSIRSFTLGYDLFHPHRCVVWHEYTRAGRTKHWDDHTVANKPVVGMAWHERDVISKRRLRKMLREEDNGEDITGFDLGSARSHRDYEIYAGIDFAGRRLHPDTRAGRNPPTAAAWDVPEQQDLKRRDAEGAEKGRAEALFAPFQDSRAGVSPCLSPAPTPESPHLPREALLGSFPDPHQPFRQAQGPEPAEGRLPHQPRWFTSVHCRSAAHCVACRHDEEFRESLVKAGMVEERDFACPFGMSPPSPNEGPGTRLMRLLRRLGFRHSAKCRCQDMALKMNLGGGQWCRENIDEIMSVMREAAPDPASNPLKLPFIEWGARKIILHCAKE